MKLRSHFIMLMLQRCQNAFGGSSKMFVTLKMDTSSCLLRWSEIALFRNLLVRYTCWWRSYWFGSGIYIYMCLV